MIHTDPTLFNKKQELIYEKIIAFLIAVMFASAAFAAAPVVEKSISTGSESLISTQGLNNNADEETGAVDAPEPADASGAQDAED